MGGGAMVNVYVRRPASIMCSWTKDMEYEYGASV